jgi:hypothetical protein
VAHRTLSSLAAGAAALLVAALSGCAGPPQVLRGPPPQEGETSRTETRTTVKNGKVVMHAGVERAEGTWSMTSTLVEDDEILEVDGLQVTKLQTTVVTDVYSESIKVQGENHDTSESGPLAGETVLRQRLDGKWKNTLLGKAPTAKQQKELDALPNHENNDDLLPEGPVKPGFSWELKADRLRRHIGARCTSLTGEAKMTFVRTTKVNGESCLQIDVVVDVKGKMLDDDGNEMEIEKKVKGTEYRSLKTGYEVKTTLSGTMKASGTVGSGGQRVKVEMSGPVTIETATKPK